VAVVNGEQITRQELAEECLRYHGQDVLESLVNKYLIVLECQRLGLGVTQEEVNHEMQRLPKQYGVPLEQWMQMLKEERGIAPAQYASDIIWPMLALRKIAGNRLQISREELLAEYETQYGPAVKARLIVCSEKAKAEKLRAAAAAQPSEFGNLAREHSEDPTSASVKGLIQPIRRHAGNREIEQAAFALNDGEVSQVLEIGSQYVILQRESLFPARNVPLAQAQGQLEENVRQRKLREVSGTIFQELQKKATVVNVMNDPQLSRQYPGVAAQINGNNVTLSELAERCIERHGEQALDAMIHRRLIEQACKKRNVTVSSADLDKEIAEAAEAMLRPKADGSPDVESWIKMVTEQQKVSEEVYRRASVWPVVALKKLVGETQVTEDDLRRGYEANYGARVRCRAIVLNNSRRAQQVWELARKNPDPEYFGDLAEKYSIESSSRALRGQVPPIQKYGGQPELEKEAFSLKPGQLSGIVPVGPDKCVILLCEEHTVPKQVDFAEVRELIRQDVHEKKLRLAMGEYFQRLQDEASIENFLSGARHSPKRADGEKTAQPAARAGAVRR
jgi:parvulin-like peptidyl-prolyl isomerase